MERGRRTREDTRDRILASSALAAITVRGRELRDYARGGAAVELVWIIAQRLGLAVQPVSPVFLYAHNRAEFDQLSPQFAGELMQLERNFRALADITKDEAAVLLLRFTAAPPASVPSRRSVERTRVRN